MSYLKNINDLDSQELSSMEDFRFFTDPLLCEANHVSNVTDDIIHLIVLFVLFALNIIVARKDTHF